MSAPSKLGRSRLPNRRDNVSETIEIDERTPRLSVTFGKAADDHVAEIFVDGHKVGSQAEALLDDACILVSILLQHGYTARDLEACLSRESIISKLLSTAADLERRAGNGAPSREARPDASGAATGETTQ